MRRSTLAGRADEVFHSKHLTTQREANDLKLRQKRVELGKLRFACPGQVARRNVDYVIRVPEVRGAHVLRIGIRT